MQDDDGKSQTTQTNQTDEYSLSVPDIKEVVGCFIDFKQIEIIKSIKHSPDKHLTLLGIDNNKYVLDATDYFEKNYDTTEAIKIFSLKKLTWLKPKNNESDLQDSLTISYNKSKNYIVLGLAVVE